MYWEPDGSLGVPGRNVSPKVIPPGFSFFFRLDSPSRTARCPFSGWTRKMGFWDRNFLARDSSYRLANLGFLQSRHLDIYSPAEGYSPAQNASFPLWNGLHDRKPGTANNLRPCLVLDALPSTTDSVDGASWKLLQEDGLGRFQRATQRSIRKTSKFS